MSYSKKYFPWKIFKRIVIGQFVFFLPILVASFLLLRMYLKKIVSDVEAVNHILSLLFIIILLSFVLSTLWIGLGLSTALGRILTKARRLAEREPWIDSTQDEPGEFFELDSDLNQIGKNLAEVHERISKELSEIEALMSTVPDAIVAVDEQGYPLFFNSHFAVLYHMKEFKKEKLRLTEIIRSLEILKAFDEVIREKSNISIVTTLQFDATKEARYFSISVAPLIHKGSKHVYGAIGIFHDITELKRAEKIRIDFVSNVSHELRTPLTSIKGYCDLLEEEQSKEDIKKYLLVIHRNVDRLMHLVDDLLDLSAIESGQTMLREQIFVKELTDRVLSQLEQHRKDKQHQIIVNAGRVRLYADPKRVEQVLINLIDNAIKYIPAQGTISIHWSEEAEKTILRIKDNGPGIEPTHIPRLFERFYRVDKGRSRDMGGTGLGLAIVKHIMQAHGGSVRVESELGKGTEFICSFPKS